MKTIKTNGMFNIPENYTGIVECSDGKKSWHWWLHGKRHRTDGPAVVWENGTKQWFLNGKRHREDGPAVIFSNGRKRYWLNDKRLDEQKIDQFVDELDYPVETAIKLTYWLEMNES